MITSPVAFGVMIFFSLIVLAPPRYEEPWTEKFYRAILIVLAGIAATLSVWH